MLDSKWPSEYRIHDLYRIYRGGIEMVPVNVPHFLTIEVEYMRQTDTNDMIESQEWSVVDIRGDTDDRQMWTQLQGITYPPPMPEIRDYQLRSINSRVISEETQGSTTIMVSILAYTYERRS